MRVIFHPEAHAEMIEHARYYEAKSEGLGSDFLAAVEETTQRIEQYPEAGPIDQTFASGSSPVFLSRSYTKCSQTESTSRL